MIGLWLLVAVLVLIGLACREARWIVLPLVVLFVAFGLMCERGEREKEKERK